MEYLKEGDIIGFSGNSWLSVGIQLATYGLPWRSISHLGIIGKFEGELLLFESTTLSDLPCVIRGDCTNGTQAVRPKDRVRTYNGRVWHYPLYRPLFGHESLRLGGFLAQTIGLPYDYVGAFRAGGRFWSWLESKLRSDDLLSIFCSEWVAAAHSHIGILPTAHVSKWNPNRLIRAERYRRILRKPGRLTYEDGKLCTAADLAPEPSDFVSPRGTDR